LGNLQKTDLSGANAVDQIYQKIWGLKKLEKMGFPVPPYEIIDITKDKPENLRDYSLRKIDKVKIPHEVGDRMGVTIRVSMPGQLDKLAKHGGLHVIEESEVLKKVLDKYKEYGPNSKILIQHTVDARCSGAILKEDAHCVIETIPGDAPPLLEGHSTNYEKWVFLLKSGLWQKERAYVANNQELPVLTRDDLQKLERCLKLLTSDAYLEWSISKKGELFFYEYCKLINPSG